MFAVILFQINILALALFSAFQCAVRKKNEYDGDGDVSLIQATPQHYAEVATAKPRPQNDDFSVGIPPPHIPLADKSDERTLADIESIQSEKVVLQNKKKLMMAPSKPQPPKRVLKSPSKAKGKP